MTLSATIVDFISGDSSRKRAALRREAPDGGERRHRLPGLPTHRGQPDNSRYANQIARVGSNIPWQVTASDGIRSEPPNGFAFTYYVAKVNVQGR